MPCRQRLSPRGQRAGRWVVLAFLIPLWGAAPAAEPKVADAKVADAADADLLEFLGSLDSGADAQAASDDGSWIDYLSHADLHEAAKPTHANDTSQPASGDQRNNE